MMRIGTPLLSAATLAFSITTASAEPQVLASIKPVHSLVAAVMEGAGTPGLIVEGAASPHTYSLKPSQAAKLQDAELVFWVGHQMEAFLEKPIETIGANATSVELIDAPGLIQLEFREGGAFAKHDHDEESHEAEEAGHDHHEDGKDEDHASEEIGHDDHAHGHFDAHIWLDPHNAKALVRAIEGALAKADPDNASLYAANAESVTARLDALMNGVQMTLDPVKDRGFIVFHDAYQHFENRFGLEAAGSITVSPDVMPGAERVGEIQAKVRELGATCVFAEPQFEPKLVSVVTEGTNAKSGIIDPLGSSLRNGPDLYFKLIENMAAAIRDCLSEAS